MQRRCINNPCFGYCAGEAQIPEEMKAMPEREQVCSLEWKSCESYSPSIPLSGEVPSGTVRVVKTAKKSCARETETVAGIQEKLL